MTHSSSFSTRSRCDHSRVAYRRCPHPSAAAAAAAAALTSSTSFVSHTCAAPGLVYTMDNANARQCGVCRRYITGSYIKAKAEMTSAQKTQSIIEIPLGNSFWYQVNCLLAAGRWKREMPNSLPAASASLFSQVNLRRRHQEILWCEQHNIIQCIDMLPSDEIIHRQRSSQPATGNYKNSHFHR